VAEGGFDLGLLVGDEVRTFDTKASCLKGCGYGGPRGVRSLAASAGIADGEDHSLGWLRQGGWHGSDCTGGETAPTAALFMAPKGLRWARRYPSLLRYAGFSSATASVWIASN
jgi:hypothetical protein